MKKAKNAEANGTTNPEMSASSDVPTMTKADLKKAFSAYDVANDKVEKAREELEKALAERSTIVERIATGAGKGPFSYRGTVLSPVCRTTKATGDKRWFFKGPGKSDLVEV